MCLHSYSMPPLHASGHALPGQRHPAACPTLGNRPCRRRPSIRHSPGRQSRFGRRSAWGAAEQVGRRTSFCIFAESFHGWLHSIDADISSSGNLHPHLLILAHPMAILPTVSTFFTNELQPGISSGPVGEHSKKLPPGA